MLCSGSQSRTQQTKAQGDIGSIRISTPREVSAFRIDVARGLTECPACGQRQEFINGQGNIRPLTRFKDCLIVFRHMSKLDQNRKIEEA